MELKNCPFCGSDDVSIKAIRGSKGWFVFARCAFCGSQGKTFGNKVRYSDCDEFWEDDSIGRATKAWNMRAGDPDV